MVLAPFEELKGLFFERCHAKRSVARFAITMPDAIFGAMQPKEYFLQKIVDHIGPTIDHASLLDLGSGQSRNFIPLLTRHPNMTYVGVEPSARDAEVARELLRPFPNARVYTQLAYEPVTGEQPFDICLSLSVLEHVKQLDRFIENSVRMTKQGGHIIHRWDLGHSLHPSSFKERFQVFLGNHLPLVLPEHKFVRYVDSEEVSRLLATHGARVITTTYHQMPSHKEFLKYFATNTPEKEQLADDLLGWESAVSPHLDTIPKRVRERLFPSICVWAVKG